jgi:hypothetical protein
MHGCHHIPVLSTNKGISAFPAPGGYGILYSDILTKHVQCYFHVFVYLFASCLSLSRHCPSLRHSSPVFHSRHRFSGIRLEPKDKITPRRTNSIVVPISSQPLNPRKRKRHRITPAIIFPKHKHKLASPRPLRFLPSCRTYEYKVQNVPLSGPADEILLLNALVILSTHTRVRQVRLDRRFQSKLRQVETSSWILSHVPVKDDSVQT